MGRTVEVVKEIISDYLTIDASDIRDDDHLINVLGLDSLDSIEMILKLEEELGVELSDEELETVKTVEALTDALDRKLAK